ncbi:MAG: IS110 family transposase [Verrucomicrobiota bacterium]
MSKTRENTTVGELPSMLEAGVDISKARLDVHFEGDEFHLPNTAAGVRRLLKILNLEDRPVRVSLEATGCYTRRLIVGCLEQGVPVSLLNARSVRAFARARGQLAKTDRIDARAIADYAPAFDPAVLDKGWPEREALQQLHKRLDGLIATRAQRRTSLEHYSEPSIRAEIKREITALGKRIETYQNKIAAIIAQDAKLTARQKAIRTITGVGEAVSTTLIVHFPELGDLNRKEAAALAGLAPMNRDSGAARGRRTIQAGRSEPRKALYMAALTAAHRNPMFTPFYKSLIHRGKPVKVALTAVARKLLVLVNSTLKDIPQTT